MSKIPFGLTSSYSVAIPRDEYNIFMINKKNKNAYIFDTGFTTFKKN